MKIKMLVAKFEPNKMHVYPVETKSKHWMRLIEGGDYITQDDRDLPPSGDMGWFGINQKEYDYYLSKRQELELEIEEE